VICALPTYFSAGELTVRALLVDAPPENDPRVISVGVSPMTLVIILRHFSTKGANLTDGKRTVSSGVLDNRKFVSLFTASMESHFSMALSFRTCGGTVDLSTNFSKILPLR
jgi:hypothetical protein